MKIKNYSHLKKISKWPVHSSDMNTIKNVWASVKRHIRMSWYNPFPSTKDVLWNNVHNSGPTIPENEKLFVNLVEFMPRRQHAVIE